MLYPLQIYGSPFTRQANITSPVCVAGGSWSIGTGILSSLLQQAKRNKLLSKRISVLCIMNCLSINYWEKWVSNRPSRISMVSPVQGFLRSNQKVPDTISSSISNRVMVISPEYVELVNTHSKSKGSSFTKNPPPVSRS